MESATKNSIEHLMYFYKGYDIHLDRVNGVIYYNIELEGEHYSSGFMPTDESYKEFLNTIKQDLDREELERQ